MTDNEIKKALEICGTYKGKCTDCPAFIKVDRSNCKKVLLGALDIINRQNAEIERLNKTLVFEINSAFERGKSEAYKEFADRLKEESSYYFHSGLLQDDIDNLLKEMGEDNGNKL